MEENLKKLKCKSILDLVLKVPRSYQNLFEIPPFASLPTQGVLKVQIHSVEQKQKVLKFKAFVPSFHQEVDLVFFHPKPFHKILFKIGEDVYIYGILQKRSNLGHLILEMIQPKKVKEIGLILPIFSKQLFKNSQISSLARSLITKENLSQTPLPKEIIQALLPIFHPTLSFFEEFQKHNAFPLQSIKALKFTEVFSYLEKMRSKKKDFPSKFQCYGDEQSFIASLPFTLTKGQKEAIETLKQDLSSSIASKRMIVGDVGCGKTIVILSAVVLAYPYKSILMAPTTILANQLYTEALKFLPSFIKVGLFTSEEKSQSFQNFDFVIGTQALLHKNEILQDFALVMSDEQHRFGTSQRHNLEKLATSKGLKPHILQFSATPIPRTMAMLQADLIAHTFITDTPFKKDIDTFVISKEDFPSLLSHIKNEIAQDHQIAIVYPLIEESKNFSYVSLKEGENFWFKHFKNVYSTNGSDKNKDEVIANFRDKGSILLSTTMIEVGISLPKLSTIVIAGAERMGLATLHQLRGRVSRNGLKGYCFLFTHQSNTQRLQEFAKTQNGFEIAEIDLKYRKSGDLLEGKHQSGNEFIFFDPSSDEALLREAQKLQNKNRYNVPLIR